MKKQCESESLITELQTRFGCPAGASLEDALNHLEAEIKEGRTLRAYCIELQRELKKLAREVKASLEGMANFSVNITEVE